MTQTIAVLGTGLMGAPMVRNLLRAGYGVRAWNRSGAKAAPLAADGADVTPSPQQAIAGADVIITMLSDGHVVGQLLQDANVQGAIGSGAIWIDMSSAKPEQARSQSRMLERFGARHLDAPVSGGTKGAQAATLAIMVGGAAATFEMAQGVLAAMGRPVHVGPSGTGQLAKLANQAIVGVTISAVAEAMLLLERGGADPAAVRNALKGGFADSEILQQHGARMTTEDFAPGGPSKLQLKDLDNALEEASALGLTLPATQDVRDRYAHFCAAMGGADKDHSALYLELLARNSTGG